MFGTLQQDIASNGCAHVDVSYQIMDDMFDSTVNIERICDITFGLVCTHVYTRHCTHTHVTAHTHRHCARTHTHTHTGTRQHHRRHTGVPALRDQLENGSHGNSDSTYIHTLIEGVHLRHCIVATVARPPS